MYEAFFQLSSRPFAAAPLVENYFPAEGMEQARQTLVRIVDRAEGPGLVIGPAGVGKSLLLRMVADHFREVFHCVHLSAVRISSRKDLLQNVLFELDLPYRDMEEGELRLSLLDFLRPSDSCPHGVLLLVDEAHTMPLRLLDEIRMITNLVRDGQPRVRLILAGGPRLEERFASPKLESFNQRIAARCYLDSLTRDETLAYVGAQISGVGGDPQALFTHDALVAVHRASDGIPRIINQVCDHALVMASLGGRPQLDAAGIEEAWADLQQLPGPWQPAEEDPQGGSTVVEFGELDDDGVGELDEPASSWTDGDAREEAAAESESVQPQASWSEPPPLNAPGALDTPGTLDTPGELDTAGAPDTGNDPPGETTHEQAAGLLAGEPDELNSLVYEVGWQPCEALPQPVQHFANPEPPADADLEPLAGADLEPPADTRFESPVATSAEPPATTAAAVTNPFGDGFVEEEVVVDRYAMLEAEIFAGRPKVDSPEGRELAAVLEQRPDRDAPAAVDVAAETRAAPPPAAAEEVPLAMFECTVFEASALPPAEYDAFVGDAAGEEVSANPADAQDDPPLRCLPLPRDEVVMDDRDLIIVDGPQPDEGQVLSHTPPAPDRARMLDYQQLFAQLRQG